MFSIRSADVVFEQHRLDFEKAYCFKYNLEAVIQLYQGWERYLAVLHDAFCAHLGVDALSVDQFIRPVFMPWIVHNTDNIKAPPYVPALFFTPHDDIALSSDVLFYNTALPELVPASRSPTRQPILRVWKEVLHSYAQQGMLSPHERAQYRYLKSIGRL